MHSSHAARIHLLWALPTLCVRGDELARLREGRELMYEEHFFGRGYDRVLMDRIFELLSKYRVLRITHPDPDDWGRVLFEFED